MRRPLEAQRYALDHILRVPEDMTSGHFGSISSDWRYGLTVNL